MVDYFKDVPGLDEAKSKLYDIRAAGDGYAVSGPMKPGQKYHDAPDVRSHADDGLFDNYAQAAAAVKKLGGEDIKAVTQNLIGDINSAMGSLESLKKHVKMNNTKGKKETFKTLMTSIGFIKKGI